MTEEDPFSGWADYYDAIHKEHEEDIDFYLEEMEKADGKVLEIGCGTGRIYIPALEKGIGIYGIDVSDDMLGRLREKAGEKGLEPDVRKADMASFDYDEKFSLITIPFRTFLHNLTKEEQVSTLRNCFEHLEEDGKLVLNFYLPDFQVIADQDGETRVHEHEIEGETYRREVDVAWEDEVEQIRTVENRLYNSEGKNVWENTFRTKIVSKREFELLLELTGFTDWVLYGGFNREELTSTDQEAVWIVEK